MCSLRWNLPRSGDKQSYGTNSFCKERLKNETFPGIGDRHRRIVAWSDWMREGGFVDNRKDRHDAGRIDDDHGAEKSRDDRRKSSSGQLSFGGAAAVAHLLFVGSPRRPLFEFFHF